MEAKINEIFSSIQGEGPVVGYKQLFIRFCGCNLNCNYCDTEFQKGELYTPENLFKKICSEYDLKSFHSVSLTGGEPLLSYKFLKEFLPMLQGKTKIYLETNATLPKELDVISNFIDIISGDIKLKSSTGFDCIAKHKEFFSHCKNKNTFGKIVFDENISREEISNCIEIANINNMELVLQPKMVGDKMSVSSEFCSEILEKFTLKYPNTRLIPQVHKFLNVR
ncbi:7-carboxy-7-deazaguanine synthase QueE [bacterium]|nr:7-carboxy-7-deazaguanine synthase QueE [bacterium]